MTVVLTFLFVFGAVAIALATLLKVLETRRKKQVNELLRMVARAPAEESGLLREPQVERLPLLERLGVDRLAAWLEVRVRQAGLDWSLERFAGLTAFAAGAAAFIGLLVPLPLAPLTRMALLAVVAAPLPALKLQRARTRRLAAFEEQFPEALDFLARSMRAGHAFTISLELLAEEMPDPLALEVRTLFNEQNLGSPIEQALANLCARVPLLDVRFFASAVMLQKQTGGNLNEILSRLAYVIRERFRLKGQVQAASAHGRMTAGILTALPVLTFAALFVIAPDYIKGMVQDKDGQALLAGCVLAQMVGAFIIRRIIDIKV